MNRAFFTQLTSLFLASCLIAPSSFSQFTNQMVEPAGPHINFELFTAQALAAGVVQMESPLPGSHTTWEFDRKADDLRNSDPTISISARGKTYFFSMRILETDLFKRIELYRPDQPRGQSDPVLFIYAMHTAMEGWGLRGAFIDTDFRGFGLTQPLITLFLKRFPDIRQVDRFYYEPLVRALLVNNFGFHPENNSGYTLYLSPKNSDRTILYMNSAADLHRFRSWTSDLVKQHYDDLRVSEPPAHATPVPMDVRLVRSDTSTLDTKSKNFKWDLEFLEKFARDQWIEYKMYYFGIVISGFFLISVPWAAYLNYGLHAAMRWILFWIAIMGIIYRLKNKIDGTHDLAIGDFIALSRSPLRIEAETKDGVVRWSWLRDSARTHYMRGQPEEGALRALLKDFTLRQLAAMFRTALTVEEQILGERTASQGQMLTYLQFPNSILYDKDSKNIDEWRAELVELMAGRRRWTNGKLSPLSEHTGGAA